MGTVAINPPKTPVTDASNSLATATLPNVCKMPGPPAPFVPTPLPNIGKSGKNPQGYTATVKFDGHTVAIRGATFDSTGDIASKGLGGGIVSSNCEGPTKFIGPGSMNVQAEGKNVQYLGDQMLNNCGPSGSPPNAATMMGVLHDLLAAATSTENVNTSCPGGAEHTWAEQPAQGTKPLDDKIRDASATTNTLGTQAEGAAGAANKGPGQLERSEQMSEGNDKIWWICTFPGCGFKREGDQLHDGPGGKSAAVEVKNKSTMSPKDARQLGRNCQAAAQGGASSLIYKLPAGGRGAWITKHVKDIGNALGVAIKVVRVVFP